MSHFIGQALINKPNKTRPVRRPRQRWMNRVKDDLKGLSNGTSIEDEDVGALVEAVKHKRVSIIYYDVIVCETIYTCEEYIVIFNLKKKKPII